MLYESIVIGGGPAGVTAAIYLARKRMAFAMLTIDMGGQTLWSGSIENYVGYNYITGPELAEKFHSHLKEFNIELNGEERVEKVVREGDNFVVSSDKNRYNTRTVIICTGAKPHELNVPGEKEFKNRGVTYCATCDGPLFADKEVAVIGGGNAGLEVCLQMTRIAKKVYLVEKQPSLTGDAVLIDKIKEEGKTEILTETSVKKIVGEKFVTGIELINDKNKENKRLDVQGVLVEVGSAPNSQVTGDVDKNNSGEIIVNCSAETSVPGIFAAGDVTNVFRKQIIIACGEGAKAAIAASEYLYKGENTRK